MDGMYKHGNKELKKNATLFKSPLYGRWTVHYYILSAQKADISIE